MNVRIKQIACILLSMVLLVRSPIAIAAWADFTDPSGHWSGTASNAYYHGLIPDCDDNPIKPDQPITKAEVLALLTRVLSASASVDLTGMGIAQGQWYEESLTQALALKVIEPSELSGLDAAMRREDAFILVARAFQLVKPSQEISVLDQFHDARDMNYGARASAAALVQWGYLQGNGDGLAPADSITWAEMVTILDRIIGSYMLPEASTSVTAGEVSIPAVVGTPEHAQDVNAEILLKPPEAEQASEGITAPDAGIEDEIDSEKGGGEPAPEDLIQSDIPANVVENYGHTPERSPSVALSNVSLNTNLLMNSYATSITLDHVITNHRILVRSARLDQLSMKGGRIAQFTLAAVTGDVDFSPGENGRVDVFTIGDGDGRTRLAGSISAVNITGDNRLTYLDMPQLDYLNISGVNNIVYISGNTQIGSINITDTAHGTTLVVDGGVDSLHIDGDSAMIKGAGYIFSIFVSGLDCILDVRHGALREDLDYGLDGVDVVLVPSMETVPAGGSLSVSAGFTGVRGPVTASAQWYRDGSPVIGHGNRDFPLPTDKTLSFSPDIVFTEDMERSVTIGFELAYDRGGVTQRVYREISVEIENYPYDYYHPGPTTDDKLIALTFDDGPGAYTNWLLDELSARDIEATFFVLGSRAEQYPDIIQRIVDDGHEIASHTYSHPNLTRLSNANVRKQLDSTNSALQNIAGVSPTSVRPPYGSYNQTVLNICEEEGLPVIYWSIDTEDWKSRNVNTILNRMFNLGPQSVRDGDIILMHDIYSTTVEAAVIAIDRLLDEGYAFVTVSNLLELRCGGGQAGQVYFHGRK